MNSCRVQCKHTLINFFALFTKRAKKQWYPIAVSLPPRTQALVYNFILWWKEPELLSKMADCRPRAGNIKGERATSCSGQKKVLKNKNDESIHKEWRSQLKKLPISAEQIEQDRIVLNYNTKYKINFHESILMKMIE